MIEENVLSDVITPVSSSKPLKYKHGRNPNSLANLRPGNPPVDIGKRGYSVTSRLKKLLEEESSLIPPNADPNDKVYRDQIARTIVNRAAIGDVGMIKELLDRTEGPVQDEKPQYNDNRQYNFLIQSEQAKEKVSRLLAGEIPKLLTQPLP